MNGAVKSSKALHRAYGEALNRLEPTNPDEVSIIRRLVAELNEEAGQWRRRYRELQANSVDLERRKP